MGVATHRKEGSEIEAGWAGCSSERLIGKDNHSNLMDDIELDGAGDELDLDDAVHQR